MFFRSKLWLLISITNLLTSSIVAQIDYRDNELKENIRYFRKATVSLGQDTVMSFEDINGQMVTKRIFRTIGTGVIFYFRHKDAIIPCIVTAKHILRDTLKGWNPDRLNIRFGNQDSLPIDGHFGDVYELRGPLNEPIWLEHPDPSVDLAVFLLDPGKENSRDFGGYIPYSIITNDEEYFEGREIYVLGYPGVVGFDLLNKPVLRRGIISWVPSNMEKSGSKILIDCNIFPGNSGGPVFLPSRNTGTILQDTIFQHPKFLGIVSEMRVSYDPLRSSDGILIDLHGNPIKTRQSVGIGIIVTAKKVRELLVYLQEDFAKWVEEMDKKKKTKK